MIKIANSRESTNLQTARLALCNNKLRKPHLTFLRAQRRRSLTLNYIIPYFKRAQRISRTRGPFIISRKKSLLMWYEDRQNALRSQLDLTKSFILDLHNAIWLQSGVKARRYILIILKIAS